MFKPHLYEAVAQDRLFYYLVPASASVPLRSSENAALGKGTRRGGWVKKFFTLRGSGYPLSGKLFKVLRHGPIPEDLVNIEWRAHRKRSNSESHTRITSGWRPRPEEILPFDERVANAVLASAQANHSVLYLAHTHLNRGSSLPGIAMRVKARSMWPTVRSRHFDYHHPCIALSFNTPNAEKGERRVDVARECLLQKIPQVTASGNRVDPLGAGWLVGRFVDSEKEAAA
jgi:hypothetical protein